MRIVNKQFHRDYEELETLEAGIALLGSEVKQIKMGRAKLDSAYVKILDDGAYLLNAEIPNYRFSFPRDYDPRRSRKLLLHKREILRLQVKLAKGGKLTLAPKALYSKGQLLKLEIALARGRKDYEKTKLVKARDQRLEQRKMMKEFMKQE
jgi:SsrA-binding protein